jgi:hypothetical protein
MYESFRAYQTALLAEFDRLSMEYNFETVDAAADVERVFAELRDGILRVLQAGSRQSGAVEPVGYLAPGLDRTGREPFMPVLGMGSWQNREMVLRPFAARPSASNGGETNYTK